MYRLKLIKKLIESKKTVGPMLVLIEFFLGYRSMKAFSRVLRVNPADEMEP